MLNVANKPFILNVVMQNAIMRNVVAPLLCNCYILYKLQKDNKRQ